MRNNRVDMMIEVEFEYAGHKESADVWVPFEVFAKAARKWFDGKSVGLDGTDNAIWNALVDLNAIGALEDDKLFNELCAEEYKGTAYEEDDYAEWLEGYKEEHSEE